MRDGPTVNAGYRERNGRGWQYQRAARQTDNRWMYTAIGGDYDSGWRSPDRLWRSPLFDR